MQGDSSGTRVANTSGVTTFQYVVSRPKCGAACREQQSLCAYQVKWSINAHMHPGSVTSARASREHATFVRTLKAQGAVLATVPFLHGAYDSVFSKDNAIIVERPNGELHGLLARPRHKERQVEQAPRARQLMALGVSFAESTRAFIEGGDVVVLPGVNGAFMGYGFRSSFGAAHDLERFLGRGVTPIELHDPRFYHLDMALSVLDDGTALVCEEALSPKGMRAVQTHPRVRSLLRIPLREALDFGANLVQVGRNIVFGANAPFLERSLSSRGYVVHRVPLEQFHHGGGSAACLVSKVHRQKSPLPRTALVAA